MVEFSQRLKQLRKEKHLTQAQVAKRIGVTASMVSSYETDIRLPSYEVLVKIATLFGVTVDYLLCREDKRFIDISSLGSKLTGHMNQPLTTPCFSARMSSFAA